MHWTEREKIWEAGLGGACSGIGLNDERSSEPHVSRTKVLDARWRGEVSVSKISPQV